MKCPTPNCPGELARVGRFYFCGECGDRIAGDDALPSTTAGLRPLEELIRRLPSILALPLREYAEAQHPVLKLWHVCDVVELALRLMVIIGVADLRKQADLSDTLTRDLAAKIEQPTLGKWRGMAEAVSRALSSRLHLVPEVGPYVLGSSCRFSMARLCHLLPKLR